MYRSFFKIIFIFGAFCSASLLSCTKCPITLPYLDIKEFDVVVGETVLNAGTPLEFGIRYERIQYLTTQKGNSQVPYHPQALYAATSCEPDGLLGLKYKITALDIFADIDWAGKPAGNSLASFLEIGVFNGTNYIYTPVLQYISNNPNGFDPEDMRFRLNHNPSNLGKVNFTFILSKSDATALSKNLPPITWN